MLISVNSSGLHITVIDELSYFFCQLPKEIEHYQGRLPGNTRVKITLHMNGDVPYPKTDKAQYEDSVDNAHKLRLAVGMFQAISVRTVRTVTGRATIELSYVLGTCVVEKVITEIKKKLRSMKNCGFVHNELILEDVV
jgi:hypothetical protein